MEKWFHRKLYIIMIVLCIVGVMMTCQKEQGQPEMLYPIANYNEKIVLGKDTPQTIGTKGVMRAGFYENYTLADAYKEAELVAELIITEWLGENDNSTFFKAELRKVYKNEKNISKTEIILAQGGWSEWTYRDYPLYTVGTELFLCLNSYFCTDSPDNKYQECFWIVGEQQTELQIYEKNGERYAIRHDIFLNFDSIATSVTQHEKNEIAMDLYELDILENKVDLVILKMEDVLRYLVTI